MKRFVLILACGLAAAPLWGQPTRPLGLREAVQLAVTGGDARVRLAQERIRLEEARADQARAALLPHLEGALSARRQTVNLQALGLQDFGLFQPPSLVGPFGTVDARGEVKQSLFNWADLQRHRAARTAVSAANEATEDWAEVAAADAAVAYLDALRARASLETAGSAVRLARELLALAEDRKEAGTGLAIEVTRAQVLLSREEQSRLLAEHEQRTALLRLLRVTGLELGQPVELTDRLERTAKDLSPEEALSLAALHRPGLRAQRMRTEAAHQAWRAARADRYPTLAGSAAYGTIGPAVGDAVPTWSAGVTLRLPVFDGGLTDARRAEQAAAWRTEQVRLRDLERQVEFEVRLGLSALALSQTEIGVSERAVEQALLELEQARRRYAAGVSTSLEVTDAQLRVREAEEARVGALFRFNLARVQVAAAVGTLREEMLP